MRVPDISSIDLSEKYQKLYEKYVEQADAPVQALESEKESYKTEKSLMQDLMDDVRSARLEYVKIKRNSIYGTLHEGDTVYLNQVVDRIKSKLSEAAQTDVKYKRLLRDFERNSPTKMLTRHSHISENEKLAKLKESDLFQDALDSLYTNAKTNIRKIQRQEQRIDIKLERKQQRALLDKYNFKISLSSLESFEQSADYMLRSFGINND